MVEKRITTVEGIYCCFWKQLDRQSFWWFAEQKLIIACKWFSVSKMRKRGEKFSVFILKNVNITLKFLQETFPYGNEIIFFPLFNSAFIFFPLYACNNYYHYYHYFHYHYYRYIVQKWIHCVFTPFDRKKRFSNFERDNYCYYYDGGVCCSLLFVSFYYDILLKW